MEVTEGRASVRDRWFILIAGVGLGGGAALTFTVMPLLGRVTLWAAFLMAVSLVLRLLGLSVVARFIRLPPVPPQERVPSFTFIIPCLNELPSLQHTVPLHQQLRYDGSLRFAYVCESASTDGSTEYVRERARHDPRLVLIEKPTPAAGRGAAIQYGRDHAPRSDVMGFLDADHVLPQESLDRLARVFGSETPPLALQGSCRAGQQRPNWLATLLSIERQWLERTELLANPRLGGFCQFGGGQGFFQQRIFDDPDLRVDESMILDDTDMSCRFALKGLKVQFDPRIWTLSREPETLSQYVDQRYRWCRGWVQLAARFIAVPFSKAALPLGVRGDLLRLVLTPLGGLVLCLGVAAAAAALISNSGAPTWLSLAVLGWPFAAVPGPYLAAAEGATPRRLLLVLLGIPMLLYSYTWFTGVATLDQSLLRRNVRYAKAVKPG